MTSANMAAQNSKTSQKCVIQIYKYQPLINIYVFKETIRNVTEILTNLCQVIPTSKKISNSKQSQFLRKNDNS